MPVETSTNDHNSSSDPAFCALVREAQINEHVHLTNYALVASFAATLIVHTIFFQVLRPLWLLYVWMLIVNGLSAFRLVLDRVWHADSQRGERIGTWENRFAVLGGFAGLSWGLVGPLSFYVDPAYQALAPIFIVGVAAGGVFSLSVQPKTFMAFYLGMLVPNIVIYAFGRHAIDVWITFTLITFAITIMSTGRLSARGHRQATELRLRLAVALDEAEASRRAAESASKAKSLFLANMSHELRTPMHAILSFSQLGASKAEDVKLASYFERIRTSGERLLALINDLLDLSKFEAGRMEMKRQVQPLVPLLEAAIQEVESLLAKDEISVALDVADAPSASIDSLRFGQVIRNLLANAAKYSPPGSCIEVRLQQTDGLLRMEIADSGPGIPEQDIDAIFDEFVQSQPAAHGHRGTGLGLAICRRIVVAHNGRIFAHNRPQGGAEFVVEIPC